MQVRLTQRGNQADLGDVDPTEVDHRADHPIPRNDARAETGVSWYHPATLPDGRRCEVIYEFSADEEAQAGDDPSALPWDDDHIDRVELDARETADPIA